MENKNNEIKIQRKCKRNTISLFLISFYSGVITILDLGVKYDLKDKKKLNTSSFSKIILLLKIPYLIKPLYGLLIDFIPILGYKKKIYLFICFFINILSWYIFLFENYDYLLISIVALFLINTTISFTTVIGSAVQIEIARIRDKDNKISRLTSNLISNYYIIKSLGTLIPSYFKGFLIEKYTNDIIFYISSFFSLLILFSALILDEDKPSAIKNKKSRVKDYSLLMGKQKKEIENNKITYLINNKNILILFLLIFILESSMKQIY